MPDQLYCPLYDEGTGAVDVGKTVDAVQPDFAKPFDRASLVSFSSKRQNSGW